jgi:ABC transport system ATP-binding/permease protein
MNILSLENVSKNYGFKPLFENVTFGLDENDKVGIIGANGSGKTTLLRIIAGVEVPDAGRVIRAGGKNLAYLSQNPPYNADSTVIETIFNSSDGVMKLLRDYEIACHDLSEHGGHDDKLLAKVSELQHELELNGGWEIETNARNILTKLGIFDTTAKMSTLSGGQRKRIALARELIVKPDILILDEPTNHLDADTVQWLENYLARYTGTLLLVTHDRYFLDRVTNRIVEIDNADVQKFNGNYGYYLEKKDEQESLKQTEEHKHKQRVKKELAWLRRGAKARTRKSKAHVDSAKAIINKQIDKPKAEINIAIGSQRLGSKIIEINGISKSFDAIKFIDNFTYLLKRDDRIGIIGANGTGKTTLLEIITNRLQPDSGNVEIGQTVAIGYYDQESRILNDDLRVIDYIKEVAEYVQTVDGTMITASQMLDRFLFPPSVQYAFIGNLSGGERKRLYLLRILMSSPNVLLLDEPTNDLDIPTLVALEEYLDDFGGALIVVSHDRYFLDRTIDSVFNFEGAGHIREYAGDYTTFLEYREQIEADKIAESKTKTIEPAKVEKKSNKLSFKEKRELETLEANIETAESRLAEIEKELTEFATDAFKLNELFGEQSQLTQQLEINVERWSELAERAE